MGNLRFSAAAFILFPTSARAGIIATDLGHFTFDRFGNLNLRAFGFGLDDLTSVIGEAGEDVGAGS